MRQLHAATDSRRHRRPLTRVRAQLRRLPALAIGLALVNAGILGCNELSPPDVPLPSRVTADSGAIDRVGGEASDASDGGVTCDANPSSTPLGSGAAP